MHNLSTVLHSPYVCAVHCAEEIDLYIIFMFYSSTIYNTTALNNIVIDRNSLQIHGNIDREREKCIRFLPLYLKNSHYNSIIIFVCFCNFSTISRRQRQLSKHITHQKLNIQRDRQAEMREREQERSNNGAHERNQKLSYEKDGKKLNKIESESMNSRSIQFSFSLLTAPTLF